MHNTNDRAQVVITKNINQAKGIVNAACGVVLGWGDKDASIAAEAGEKDTTQKRPAYVDVRLTTGSGKDTEVKILPYDEKSVWVPFCRGVAVSGAYKVTQLPLMVAACMTVHRVQGVGFERVALWIPLRGFFAQGQGYTAVSRAKTLGGLFLVIPDEYLEDKDGAKEFLQESFQPPTDAIDATDEMRERAPATVSIATGQGREIAYATLWDSGEDYFPPSRWPVSSPWPERLPMPRGRYGFSVRI